MINLRLIDVILVALFVVVIYLLKGIRENTEKEEFETKDAIGFCIDKPEEDDDWLYEEDKRKKPGKRSNRPGKK